MAAAAASTPLVFLSTTDARDAVGHMRCELRLSADGSAMDGTALKVATIPWMKGTKTVRLTFVARTIGTPCSQGGSHNASI